MPISTCDLCDKYGDQGRVVPPVFRHFGGKKRFHGLASTLRCPEDNSRLKELASTPGAGRVLVVDSGGSMRYALLGDMIGKLALEHGWAGVVLHGCMRDTAALSELDLGLMALGAVPRRSLKNGEGQVGLPVDIAGIVCTPGDWVVADEDGIVLIDPALLSDDEKR
jgi:regulator of ribonuclease activity A